MRNRKNTNMLLDKDLWSGCEAFFDALAETVAELDPTVLDEVAGKAIRDRADTLSRRLMQRWPNRIADHEQARSYERMWLALDLSFQKLVTAPKAKDRREP